MVHIPEASGLVALNLSTSPALIFATERKETFVEMIEKRGMLASTSSFKLFVLLL